MKRRPLRNIGILAHIDAGKTTLTENLLYLTGAIRYPGAVEHGSTVTDWQLQEQERGITITSAAITCQWAGVDITIVDTPGHVDFTMEVERSLRVLDGAVLVISGPEGVQAQTEAVWGQAQARRVPMIALVNKLDRPGFDDARLQVEIRERLGIEPLPLYVPIEAVDEFALVDVLGGEVVSWALAGLARHQRAVMQRRPLGEDEQIIRELAFERIVDAVASEDDGFAEEVLAGREPDRDVTCRALRAAIERQRCLPLVYGVARYGVGVEQVADAIVALLPTPDEVEPPPTYCRGTGERCPGGAGGPKQTAAAFVFKTEMRPRGERLAFVRVFDGELPSGSPIVSATTGEISGPGRIVKIMGGDTEPVDALVAGEIGGILWSRPEGVPRTGETLGVEDLPYTFERIEAPRPVIALTIEAEDAAGDEAMQGVLRQICADDPSLMLETSRDTGLTMLSGMGELHVLLVAERASRELGRPLRTGAPTVRRRHLILGAGEGRAQRADGWSGRGRVSVGVRVAPAGEGKVGLVRYTASRPRRSDWTEALEAGVLAGLGADGSAVNDVIGVEVELLEIEISGEVAPVVFRDAARAAVAEALEAAGVVAAEPWVALEIVVPEVVVGRLAGDLARRGAKIKGTESRGAAHVISAEAPLAAMIGFATDLRSMSAGRGVFTMAPMGYRPTGQAS